jgi:hypothetical protein
MTNVLDTPPTYEFANDPFAPTPHVGTDAATSRWPPMHSSGTDPSGIDGRSVHLAGNNTVSS